MSIWYGMVSKKWLRTRRSGVRISQGAPLFQQLTDFAPTNSIPVATVVATGAGSLAGVLAIAALWCFSPGLVSPALREGKPSMKLTTRKDKPSEPIISMSECWAGLQLVRHILGRIVESGDAPEQVVERSHECFRNTLGCYARTAVLRAADA